MSVRGRIEHVAYVRGQRDSVYANLARRFNNLAKNKMGIPATASEIFVEHLRKSVWVIEFDISKYPDHTIDTLQGTAFHLKGVGWVTCSHCVRTDGKEHSGMRGLLRPGNPGKYYPFKVKCFEDTVDLAVLSADIPEGEYESLEVSQTTSGNHGFSLQLVGWPTFAPGHEITITEGKITGSIMKSGIRRIRVSQNIIAGTSGGPALDEKGRVFGVAVTGADNFEDAAKTADHALIPISALKFLQSG